MHETAMHNSSWFLTLTYDEERIPQYGSLYPEDLQRFFKAVRRGRPAKTVSYFACGEYGEKTERPHYHAVLFGVDFLDRISCQRADGSNFWRSPSLENYWEHGLSEFGTVTDASASYVAGYVRKKVTRKQDPDHYERLDPESGELVQLVPEFNRMSLKPAIGRRWIEKHWKDVYPRDFVVRAGKEYKPPRYYDQWLEQNQPKMAAEVRFKRIQEAIELSEYTLASKEAIHKSRDALFLDRGSI
jgi:hypothetical protein